MSRQLDADVIVLGGGMIGLLQAACLLRAGLSVLVCEARGYAHLSANAGRVAALNATSIAVLKSLGIWSDLQDKAGFFTRLQFWAQGVDTSVCFDAAELGVPVLGANVFNAALVLALKQYLSEQPGCEMRVPFVAKRLLQTETCAVVCDDNGQSVSASLVIAADGARSWCRSAANIQTDSGQYEQHAMCLLVKTQQPHRRVARQVFLPGGPVAFLPDAQPNVCSVVWSQSSSAATLQYEANESAFLEALNQAFGQRLGPIVAVSERQMFPLAWQHAQQYVAPRVALIGDAAHQIHPLAGQGANLGFADVHALTQCVQRVWQRGGDIGQLSALKAYPRQRRGNNALMLRAMDVFAKGFGADDGWLKPLRQSAVWCLRSSPWLRRLCMQQSL